MNFTFNLTYSTISYDQNIYMFVDLYEDEVWFFSDLREKCFWNGKYF